jgi:hypothetical protein
MMKSLALNTVILYILLKQLILNKLPAYLQGLRSFQQLRDAVAGFAWKSSRMSRRMVAIVTFVAAIWLSKKIWQRLQGHHIVANFVEHYLCDIKTVGYDKCGARMTEVDRKRYFGFGSAGKSSRSANRQDQQARNLSFLGTPDSSLPLYSSGLISHRVLQRKQRSMRSQSHGHLALVDSQRRLNQLMIMGTIVEESPCADKN